MQSTSQQKDQGNQKSDADFWQYVIESQKTSGLSVRQFCKNEGLTEPTFYCWRKKLSQAFICKDKVEADNTQFIEAGTFDFCGSESLKITFPSGICLQAFESCDENLLKQALSQLVLKSC